MKMTIFGSFLVGLLLTTSVLAAENAYRQAKQQALVIYQANPKTFYCERSFDKTGQLKDVAGESLKEGATKIQWEHIMPAKQFGGHLACWQRTLCRDRHGNPFKGRKCCQLTNPTFQTMEADLHNLVPILPKLNHLRSHYAFQEKLSGQKPIDSCTFFVDKKRHTVSVDPKWRGFIARAYLYMHATYGIPLSKEEQVQYKRWHRENPPDAWEIKRHALIASGQKTINPYIAGYSWN
jgi:deoxyribonuclease-1